MLHMPTRERGAFVSGGGWRPCRADLSHVCQRTSDFDPAGEHMPIATARQIEYWLAEYAPNIGIKLTAMVLTKEQVIRYHLPRTPIKETDLRKKGFEDR